MSDATLPQARRPQALPVDDVDRQLLTILQAAARTPVAELARSVGLSAPSVADRLRKLEAAAVIAGYHAAVTPAAVGYNLSAFVRLTTPAGAPLIDGSADLFNRSEIREAHHVVGEDCWIFRVIARDTAHLEVLLAGFARYGSTTTSIVLSSPVQHSPIPL